MNIRNYPFRYHASHPVSPNVYGNDDMQAPQTYRDQYNHQQNYSRVTNDCDHLNYSTDHSRASTMHPEYAHSHALPRRVIFDPPLWATSAKGESTLEPIGDTSLTHPPVDLTLRRSFLIGRSPNSNVPLLHSTSSRRHALIFHHPNGSCYITDCHSAHGTFVDGVRVKPHPHPPKRVRRGAIIRFGGLGAPRFVLKSFSVALEEMVKDLGGVAEAYFPKPKQITKTPPIICESSSSEEDDQPPSLSSKLDTSIHQTQPSPKRLNFPRIPNKPNNGVMACIRGDGGGVACISDGKDAPEAALVLLNTRMNAVGKGALEREYSKIMVARSAQAKFEKMGLKRKREAYEQIPIFREEITSNYKRPRKSILKRFPDHVTSSNPCVTPKAIPVHENIFTPRSAFHHNKEKRRVTFSDEKVPDYYAPAVSPDEVLINAHEVNGAFKNGLTIPIL